MKRSSRYLIDAGDKDAMLSQQINWIIGDIDSRLIDLEFRASKVGKKPDISRAEKSALLYELGVMDFLLGLGVSQKKISALLSALLNASEANIEKDLSTRHNVEASFKNEEVYKAVVERFTLLKMDQFKNTAQERLDKFEQTSKTVRIISRK